MMNKPLIKIINKKSLLWILVLFAGFSQLTGCSSPESHPQKSQVTTPATDTALYNQYMQEINNLPANSIKYQQFGKYKTAEVDYYGFTQAKDQLDQQIKADPSLNPAQKATLSQALQNKTGADCDAIAAPINAQVDNAMDHPNCDSLHDGEFSRLLLLKRGAREGGKILEDLTNRCQ